MTEQTLILLALFLAAMCGLAVGWIIANVWEDEQENGWDE